MRILFIDSPPTRGWAPASGITKGGRRWPSLTVTGEKTYCINNLASAAVLRERGHEVHLVDCQAEGITLPELLERAATIRSDLVVMYVEQIKVKVDFEIIEQLKKSMNPKVVFVGPFVTPLDQEVMAISKQVDFVIRGEYDYAVADLAEGISNGGAISDISGITWRDGDRIIQGPPPRAHSEFG